MDLDDLEHNTRDGLHIAALAGSWIALIAGFAGMRDINGELCFAPRLPEALTRLAFTVTMRGRRLAVDITAPTATYTLQSGQPIGITHHGQQITVATEAPITRPIPDLTTTTPRPTQPLGRAPTRRGRTE